MSGVHAASRHGAHAAHAAGGGHGSHGAKGAPDAEQVDASSGGGKQAVDGADALGALGGPTAGGMSGCGCGGAQATAGGDAIGEVPDVGQADPALGVADAADSPEDDADDASKDEQPKADKPGEKPGDQVQELKKAGVQKLPGESSHDGLTPKALEVLGSAQAGGLKLISGLRAGETQGHGNGSAVDVSNVPGGSKQESKEMEAFAESVRAAGKAGDPNIGYVIYKQRIASARDGWAWRPMEDRGSNTQNHFDHVHVSTDPNR